MNVKDSIAYQEAIEGKNIISETSEADDTLHIVGIETKGIYEFIRFSYEDGEWAKNEESMEMDIIDFKRKIVAPKLRKGVIHKRARGR